MKDTDVLQHINQLAKEEHELLNKSTEGGLTEEERARLQELKIHLDQLWDLLRQRRAREEFNMNPDEVAERDPSTVEHYLQ
jgi:hypothetical protein